MTSSHILILNNSDISYLNRMLYNCNLSLIIPDDRLRHIKNHKYPLHRASLLCADLLCIYSLALFTGETVTGYDIHRISGEKPYLPDHPNIDFSYSHNNNAVLCAITDEGRIGADIEYIDPELNGEDLLYALSSEELAYINTLHASKINTALLSLWTKKEAYTKCLGTGLSVSPETVNTLSASVSDKLITRIYGNYIYSVFHTDTIKTYTS